MKNIEIKSITFGTLYKKEDKLCNNVEITLKNNPYAKIKDFPSRFYAVKGNKEVGGIDIFQMTVVADREEYIANCGSGLSVSQEERGQGIGKKLAICRLNASPDQISIGSGLSDMSYPLYKKIGCHFFYSPRMGLFINPRKIVHGYLGKLSVAVSPIIKFIMLLLALPMSRRNYYIKRKYRIYKLTKAGDDIEKIVTDDSCRFCEKHTKEWFNWTLKYGFSTEENEKNYLYAIKDKENQIEAFFMFKARIKNGITSRHINNVQVISLIEWGIKKDSSITEKDIVASFSDVAKKKGADIIEVSFLSPRLMKSLTRMGFVKMLDGRIMLYAGENSPLRQHEGWNEEKNWRLRPACSDYGFC